MSLESVKQWLAANAPDLRLIEVKDSTATVNDAARALGVEPGRIAKTLAVRVGDKTFLLDALPPFVRVSDARRFVLELVDALKATGEGVNSLRLAEHTVAKTVCRHAVKANDPLAEAELQNLVNDLRQCTMPYTCPHGRPTLIEMNFRELEKKFGRRI